MNLNKLALPVLAVIGLLLMVAWMAGTFDDKLAPDQRPPVAVDAPDTIVAEAREVALFEAVPASIEARQATIISSRLLARIETIAVRAGDMVTEGQVLVQLEERDLESRVSQARSRIESVSARLAEARLSLSRAEDLAAKRVIPQANLDSARANHDALIADLSSAEQALQEAEAAQAFAVIRAPIDGRIVDRFAEPGDTAQPGVPLLSLYNPVFMRVEANVREQLALSLTQDQPIRVRIPSRELELDAVLEELVPAGDPGSRSFLVKGRLQESQGLLPGMYAQLLVPAGTSERLLVPVDRIAHVGQLELVWVRTADALERRLVRTGRRHGGDIEVISGLAPGDEVARVPGRDVAAQ